MTSKELKRLSRSDLLEMLLELSRENDTLRKENADLLKRLKDRTLTIEKSGSLAEAALQLNGVFEAAQAACRQYTENVRARSENMEQHCRQMEQQTQAKCEQMLAQAQEEAKRCVEEAKKQRNDTYAWLADLMDNGETQ